MYQTCIYDEMEASHEEWIEMLENDEISEVEEAFMVGWMGAYEEEW